MKILFFMRSTVYLRNFESTIRMLAERGHEVHVAAEPHPQLDPSDMMGRLKAEFPSISHSSPPPRLTSPWPRLAFELRRGLDYLRYLGPEYRDAPKLRQRAEEKAPPFVLSWLEHPRVNTDRGRALLALALRLADRAVPSDEATDAFVREHAPDLVLVTPLVEPGSPQSEYLRSARALGIRTALCVYSWDNLTNKGLIHDPLDLVTVWNPPMKAEALTLHHQPARRVVVTGAPGYDHWFAWQPSTTREAFCARVGLDPARPYLLYLCSSKFIAPEEVPFIRRWITTLRASSRTLKDVGVLVRPHPQNTDIWEEADLSDLDQVTVWPRAGANPVDTDSRSEYYDSIFHSAAVVGVNTSAQIESAIVGRGVYTVLAPEFSDTQEGTLHFRHLRDVNGGLLNLAEDFPEHVAQLEAAITDPRAAEERCRRFVEGFVRPFGVDQPATPRLVDTLEALAARPRPRPSRGPWWAPLARPALTRLLETLDMRPVTRGWRPPPTETPNPAGTKRKHRERAAQAALAAKPDPALKKANSQLKALAAQATRDAQAHYERLIGPMRALIDADVSIERTPAERLQLEALDPIWAATPDTLADMRQFGKAISGTLRADYRGMKAELMKQRLDRDLLRVIEKTDRGLWVDEPTVLGGFWFATQERRYNEDTLRYLRVLSLLQDAALLAEFRAPAPRRTVWEIGGGWGGFAYQFKTLFPNVTYLITGAPATLLLSGVYLSTLLPGARVRVYDPAHPEAFWDDWASVDIALAPESAVPALRPPSLDLTVDVMALEKMTAARIEAHVRRAHELGCRYFFTVCPSGEPDPELALPVRPAVEQWYWPHPISAPLYVGKRLALGGEKRAGRRGALERTYLLGWRRLHA
jgi:hypothetical protein